MKEIQVYGAGGHSFAVIELIRALEEYTPTSIVDDKPNCGTLLGIPVKKFTKKDSTKTSAIAIGNNKSRKKVFEQLSGDFPIFVHPSAVVYPSAKIGQGCVVFPNSVIDADVHLDEFCIVNNNATVSHNVRLGKFVHIAIQASICGGVEIGEGTLIGAGSIILPETKIGKWVTIGAGAVVTKDIPDNALVYGNPGKIIK
ncbi:acetyltransferase [Patiriisocius sp. Uisw_017]|jgi:sugar O-acyltransferase (sialic acid O-acetyltransferase NeuD family)|uniref:acetyltransferase n=1 Tax=Patiriisocius sp. Uisw_017 TaxID=3230968 RepID=UPI0039E90A54